MWLNKLTFKFIPVVIFFFFFAVYILSTPDHPTGYADAEELATIAYLGSVAHPPGYPFLTTLLGFFMHLLPLRPIFTANLSSAFFMALALAITYLNTQTLIRLTTKPFANNPFWSIQLPALYATLALGFSYLIWLNGTRLEVTALSVFIVSLFIYCLQTTYVLPVSSSKYHFWLFLTAIIYGFGLAHIQTLILLAPGLSLVFLVKIKNFSSLKSIFFTPALIVLGIGLGFVFPQIFLWFNNQKPAPFSWQFEPSLTGLTDHLLRRDYSGLFLDENQIRPAYLLKLPDYFWSALPEYLRFLPSELGYLYCLLILLGLYVLITKRSLYNFSWILFVLFTGPLFGAYLGFPDNSPNSLSRYMIQAITQRQYLIGFILFIPLTGLGLSYFISSFKKPKLIFALSFGLIAILVFKLNQTQKLILESNLPLVDQYVRGMLTAAAPDAMIICNSDVACFPLMYYLSVENVRPDLILKTQTPLYTRYSNRHETSPFASWYQDNPDYVANLIALNLKSKPVYYTNPIDYYIEYIGLNADPFYLLPDRYSYRVSLEAQSPIPPQNYPLSDWFLVHPPSTKNLFARGFQEYLASIHTLSASIYLNHNQPKEARYELDYALNLAPGYETALSWLAQIPYYQESDYYVNKPKVDSTFLLKSASKALLTDDLSQVYSDLRKLSYLEPTNLKVRLMLADTLVAGKYYAEALRDINQILKIKPDDLSAQNRKKLLESTPQNYPVLTPFPNAL